jgi:hypothetical protein
MSSVFGSTCRYEEHYLDEGCQTKNVHASYWQTLGQMQANVKYLTNDR